MLWYEKAICIYHRLNWTKCVIFLFYLSMLHNFFPITAKNEYGIFVFPIWSLHASWCLLQYFFSFAAVTAHVVRISELKIETIDNKQRLFYFLLCDSHHHWKTFDWVNTNRYNGMVSNNLCVCICVHMEHTTIKYSSD